MPDLVKGIAITPDHCGAGAIVMPYPGLTLRRMGVCHHGATQRTAHRLLVSGTRATCPRPQGIVIKSRFAQTGLLL
jgi:hypothetical protein